MSSPHLSSSGPSGSRRSRYSRSPSNSQNPPLKRSKPSSSADAAQNSDQNRLYTSICVKNINPKIPDADVRQLCNRKFSKYGNNTVKIYYKNQERVAFVNFSNCEDARKARHAKTGLIWDNVQVVLEPVYYRRTVPAEQPITPGSPKDRSPSPKRRPRRRSPSPSPIRSRPRSPRFHRTLSPARPKRTYSPYIPLPPDLMDFVNKGSNGKQNGSSSNSPSPTRRVRRRRTPSKSRSSSRSPSPPVHQKNRQTKEEFSPTTMESNVQHEPTRTLFIGNLERDVTEAKIREKFGRYGTIEEIDLKIPQTSSKRAYAFIQYENMDMAYEARKQMDGRLIGKADCKIGYGKIVPTSCLWVGNIPMDMKRRDIEDAFSRYGQIKSFDYSTGDPTAIVNYNDIEDAIKARAKMTGVIRLNDGQKIRAETENSDSSRLAGLRIDYIDRPTNRRFVIVRPQDTSTTEQQSRSSSNSSNHSPMSKDRPRSISPETTTISRKTKKHDKRSSPSSKSPTTKKRRSSSPTILGRSFRGELGSYFSSNQTKSINNIDDLMNLCEKLHRQTSKTKSSLCSMYPVDYILKLHAHPARMHFLAGNPNLADRVLGDFKDQKRKKTELKVTQRLRLDDQKLDENLEKLRNDVKNIKANQQSSSVKQAKFAILFSSAKDDKSNGQNQSSGNSSDDETDRKKSSDDQNSLTEFISYLTSKEAAGVITMDLPSKDDEKKSKSISLNIYPPCKFTNAILKTICSSISFSKGPHTPPSRPTKNEEYLLLLIEQTN